MSAHRKPGPPYAELAAATNFSFLRGASHPEELVDRAVALGHAALGITDRNSLAGVVRAHVVAKERGFRIVVGTRLVFCDGTPDIFAWPEDRAAYGRLCRLLTTGNRRAEKGDCRLALTDLLEWGEGLLLAVLPGPSSYPASGGAQPDMNPANGITPAFEHVLGTITGAFPGMVHLVARFSYDGDDRRKLALLVALADRCGTPLLAINDVLYHAPDRRPLQDIVTCVRERRTLKKAGLLLAGNAERYLKAPAEMSRLFRDYPQAIIAVSRLLSRIHFSLDELRYEYPDEPAGQSATPQDELIRLTGEGARKRYPGGVPDKVRGLIAHEIGLIGELDYARYFLTVHDIVRFARSRGILAQGRGSAANSAVCFCLGITEVDPARMDLLFERFISAERREPPDIDVDFEHERREEVIQYIYEKYSRDRAGLTATVTSYRARSAVREVGKAFGLSEDAVGGLASAIWGWSESAITQDEVRRRGLDPSDPSLSRMLELSREIVGFPRHLSQHVGGFIITRDRLDETVPIQNAAMQDRTVVEWDKDDLDALGILKIDVLGLGMLTCVRKALDMLRDHYDRDLTLATIPAEDPAVYRMLQRADSVGVFQVESRAQMTMLPRLKPKDFYDLVIEVAIVRPGPIQGDMVHPYLRRRQGIEKVEYPAPSPEHGPPDELEKVLGKTLGVPLFQEQAMKIAIVAAGFTPSEADRLRRAMATFRRVGTIGTFQAKMIDGMTKRGYDRDFAERCFHQIEGFGEYGFPESHAASFALLVYASSWLKCHYPDVFAAALLNSQPMGFYAPAQIVRDAIDHGVRARAVDINLSDWDNTLEKETEIEGFPETPPHPDPPPRGGREKKAMPHSAPSSLWGGDARKAGLMPGVRATAASPAAARLHALHADMRDDVWSDHAIRLGFRQIKGIGEDDARLIVEKRGDGYDSLRDLWLRTGLPAATIERLADADAFRSIGLDRRAALWVARGLDKGPADSRKTGRLPLFEAAGQAELRREPDVALPPMPLGEQVVNDYRFLKLSLKAHPTRFLRDRLTRLGAVRHETLRATRPGRRLTVAGLVLVRQRPGSAKGVIFMTLEDETAVANVIVWPKVFERYRAQVIGARLIAATGRLQNEQNVIHLVADRVDDLTPLLATLADGGEDLEALARCDEVRRPVPDIREKVARRSRLGQLLTETPELAGDLEKLAKATHAVLPKGRNFH